MPAIPIIQQTVGVNPSYGPRAQAEQVVDPMAGLSGIAGGLERNAQANALDERLLNHQKEQDAQVYAGRVVSDAHLTWQDTLQKRQESAQPGAPNFTPDLLKEFDAWRDDATKAATTPMSKKYLDQHLTAYRTELANSALHFEAQARIANRVDQHQQSVDTWAKVVEQDPSKYDLAMSSLKETLPAVGPMQQEKLRDYQRKALTEAAAASQVQTHPDAVYDTITRALHPGGEENSNMPSLDPAGAPVANQYNERGLRNNNPGNIRKGPSDWFGQVPGNDASFVSFATPEAGIRALGKNLISYQDNHGINTVEGIVSRWAPATENSTGAYITNISKALGVAPNAPIDVHDKTTLSKLTTAIIKKENDKQPYSDSQISSGVDAALGNKELPASVEPPQRYAYVDLTQGQTATDAGPDNKPAKTGVSWIDNMTVPELLHYQKQAQIEVERGISGLQTELRKKEVDLHSMALSGVVPPAESVPTQAQYIRAYGQMEGMQIYQERITPVVELAKGMQAMTGMSIEDRSALIQRNEPIPGDGFDQQKKRQHALIQANQIIEKQLTDDPAAYASKNSRQVQIQLDNMRTTLQVPDATDEMKRAAVDAYATAMIAEQNRLGVTQAGMNNKGDDTQKRGFSGPKILSNAEANRIAQLFYDQKEGGDNSAKLVSGLEQQWGPHWPTVYAQLAADNKIPPAALVIPNMKDAQSRERLARWSLVDDKAFKERLAPTDPRDIEQKLQTTLQPFWDTLKVQGGGERTYETVESQARKLALGYAAGGKSIGDAVKQAAEETVNHAYEFHDTYRIPKQQSPNDVMQGVSTITRNLHTLPLELPVSGIGLKDDARNKAYLDIVKNGATWVTSPDESGLVLYAKGVNGLNVVRKADGSPVKYSWSELRNAGEPNPGSERLESSGVGY